MYRKLKETHLVFVLPWHIRPHSLFSSIKNEWTFNMKKKLPIRSHDFQFSKSKWNVFALNFLFFATKHLSLLISHTFQIALYKTHYRIENITWCCESVEYTKVRSNPLTPDSFHGHCLCSGWCSYWGSCCWRSSSRQSRTSLPAPPRPLWRLLRLSETISIAELQNCVRWRGNAGLDQWLRAALPSRIVPWSVICTFASFGSGTFNKYSVFSITFHHHANQTNIQFKSLIWLSVPDFLLKEDKQTLTLPSGSSLQPPQTTAPVKIIAALNVLYSGPG